VSQVPSSLRKGDVLRPATNALTIDVEEYFQVTAFNGGACRGDWESFESRVVPATETVLSLLAKHGTKATFFIVGWVARRHPGLVRTIRREGHEIACHGYAHREISDQNPKTFREDVRLARTILEEITGEPVRGYRAPTFSITDDTFWALGVLIDEGFRYDSSIFPIRHDRYGIPNAERFPNLISCGNANRIWEFPMSTLRTMGMNLPFSGGGYMRLLPPRFVSWAIQKLNRQGQPAIIYVHPWEFDPGQPRIPCSTLTRFRHYHNLPQMSQKFEHLLARHNFGPVSEVLENYARAACCPATCAKGEWPSFAASDPTSPRVRPAAATNVTRKERLRQVS
jgi:polysaccharide deacetylase family protein (PEP-CTERM system associated)